MTDARLVESFLTHPVIDELSDVAHRVYVNGLVYAVSHGTDGHLPRRALRYLHPSNALDLAVRELTKAGLWEVQREGGWVIRNFLVYQRSAEQVQLAREGYQVAKEKAAERQRKARIRRATSPVTRDITGDQGRDESRDSQGQGREGQGRAAPRPDEQNRDGWSKVANLYDRER